MPIKVHVKGKRKAPQPPSIKSNLVCETNIEAANVNANISSSSSSSGQCLNLNNGIAINKNSSAENALHLNDATTQKRKKQPAPPVPPSPINANSTNAISNASEPKNSIKEINNLSATTSKRITEKLFDKKINFNIVEQQPTTTSNQIRNMFEPYKSTNEGHFNANVNIRLDKVYELNDDNRVPQQQKNTNVEQIWVCANCTLRNPFWKIVCEACEKIKPYNTPNLPLNPVRDFDDELRINEKNNRLSAVVKMRPKAAAKVNNDFDKIYKRTSMRADMQQLARKANEMTANDDKIGNKRNSSYIGATDELKHPMTALEMEKERIRSVIQRMNNRALAQKYPLNDIRKEHPYEAIKESNIRDQCGASKNPSKRNAIYKTDLIIDYSFPPKKQPEPQDYYLQTDDSKANFEALNVDKINKVKKTADTSRNATDEYYEFMMDDLNNYCDQTILGNTIKKLESHGLDKKTARTENSLKFDNKNNILINLYVNFNNAIEVNVQHTMTLNEFKYFISRHVLAPCRNPKIYFNGLLMHKEDDTLAMYGIKNRSSLYINTENVVAHTKNAIKSVENKLEDPKPLTRYQPKAAKPENKAPTASTIEIAPKLKEIELEVKPNTKADAGEKYLIEHIQLNRFTIEKINPEVSNLSKTKYRGVCNYNPRCNPDVADVINAQKKANEVLTTAAPSTSKLCGKPVINETKVEIESKTVAEEVEKKINQYIELLSLDDSNDLTKSSEPFECSICLVDYEAAEGVILRNCLHTFCKDCIRNTIIYSEEAEVKCPYIDKEYTCDYHLQDREIKALLSKAQHDEHLAKSLRIAENQIENSFHCRTPNCKGWCIYEDDVNSFKCPICQLENCLTCRVIHDGLNCQQYQTMMKNNVENNPENATTLTMLDEMIKNGDAMNCPTCRIVLMKKWGCDWLKCSMCKTEICWVTRGFRWGAAGKGDLSGGCKCGVGGFKCHPKCNYCH